MIEINLVPVNLRKRAGSAGNLLSVIDLPRGIVVGVGGLFVFILISIHLLLIGIWGVKFSKHHELESTWQKMSPDKQNLDSINSELKDIKAKTTTITDLTSKKSIRWSEKFNILSNVMPKGVWLRRIFWNNNVLTIEGNAVSKLDDEISLVGSFVANLKKEENFAKDFNSLELNSVTRSKKGSTDVADFTIIAKVK